MIDDLYAKKVLDLLSSGPTEQDLDFLCEAYTKIGYYAAVAAGDADMAEAERKVREAEAFLDAKHSADRVSEATANAMASVATVSYKRAEVTARTKARKLFALHQSIEQAIHAVKFIGRQIDPVPTIRLPQ